MADLVPVNAHRMKAARESAGLSVWQLGTLYDIDVRPGEHFGQMPPDVLERVRDMYGVRPGWLEEHGPINDPAGPWGLIEAIGTVSAYRCRGRA